MTLQAPFPYFGGKSRAADLVWERLGDVDHFIEPFAGSCAVLLARPHRLVPYQIETVNDLDGYVVNFWRALRADEGAVVDAADWPVTELDMHARNAWLIERRAGLTEQLRGDPGHFDAEVAGWWLWGACMWVGSGWAAQRSRQIPRLSGKGTGIHCHAPPLRPSRATIEAMLAPLAERLRGARIVCGDWQRVVTPSVLWPSRASGGGRLPGKVTGVFLDPAYLEGRQQYAAGGTGSRLALDVLEWCMEHDDIPELRLVLCGYEGHYDALAERGWAKVHWKAKGGYGSQADGAARERSAREVLWCSPSCLDAAQPCLFGGAP